MKQIAALMLFMILTGCTTCEEAKQPAHHVSLHDAKQLLAQRNLSQDYIVYTGITPNTLRGDFDGDSQIDVAAMIKEKKSEKIGLVILAANGENYFAGAGHPLGNGGDDFIWLDHWSVYKKSKKVHRGAGEGKPPKLKGDVLFAEKEESASCIIYYDGSTIKWYQQGD
jgi:hypothetical protein